MTEPAAILIREPRADEQVWVEQHLRGSWGSVTVVSRGRVHDASRLPAFVATAGDELVGLATFRVADGECELVTLTALHKGRGIGSALLARVAETATEHGCHRLWLVTSNDNLDAIRFYQRRGLRLAALHRGAVDDARRLKPTIPLFGAHGIRLHDELEFELQLE